MNKLLLPITALLSLLFSVYSLRAVGAEEENVPLQAVVDRVLGGAQYQPASVNDVVAKANAFKALLTPAQLQVLEQPYTTTLARRWSNLPCTNTCRNGIGLGTLNAEQLAAALEVIKAAAGTRANEGADEFNQIRMADTLLAASGGAGGPGGLTYGEGYYYLAFLNSPSTSEPFMIQYGGHHYGANIAFNRGHIVGTTPLFEALEPLTFESGGKTYSPLAQERNALAAMLASLSATQLATAKLSTTFSDTTMSPGESNGGNGNFPATKVGLAVSTLSKEQKRLVFEAMKPWVQDMEDSAAAKLLAIYQAELDGTYIAFTGNGVAGDASSFLVSNANYARIDGPSVWIEFACQGGVVFRNQIHYHTVWRDHLRDYGKDLSLTTALDATAAEAGTVATASTAGYTVASLAPSGLGLLRGKDLAAAEAKSTDGTLPASLGEIEVQLRDSDGMTHSAPLYAVSPEQISFQTPEAVSPGAVSITVLRNGSVVSEGTAVVEATVPGLFTANASGQGIVAGYILRRKADGSETREALVIRNGDSYEPVPVDLGAEDDAVYVVALGSGFRNAALETITATIGGVAAEVASAGANENLAGADQVTIRIPRSLAGRGGDADLVLTAAGRASNVVTLRIQ